jgi:hypothetical protein
MAAALGEFRRAVSLKRFQAKWIPVRIKKTRQIKNLEPRFDSIETEKALVHQRHSGMREAQTSDAQLRIGESLDSGFARFARAPE